MVLPLAQYLSGSATRFFQLAQKKIEVFELTKNPLEKNSERKHFNNCDQKQKTVSLKVSKMFSRIGSNAARSATRQARYVFLKRVFFWRCC